MNEYLQSIENNNSRKSAESLIKKLKAFYRLNNDNDLEMKIKTTDSAMVELFLKKECEGKSETTISNTINQVKKIFKFYNNNEAIQDFNLMYIKKQVNHKNSLYYTPNEVKNIINNTINFQDKALILLTYLGLYDNNFNAIRNLKKEYFYEDERKIVIPAGAETKIINLTNYATRIVKGAIDENFMEKYNTKAERRSSPYALKDGEYIFKNKDRAGALDKIGTMTLKKRIEAIKNYIGDENLSPVTLKNSKNIYDLVNLEYKYNFGMDINQLELRQYMKDNQLRGSIELLNISKKNIKDRIIKEIVSGEAGVLIAD